MKSLKCSVKQLGKTVYIWLWVKATGLLYCYSYWILTCLKLNRPPQILDINIKLPLRNYIKEDFLYYCYNAYITSTNDYANVFLNITTALALTGTNIICGFTIYIPVNLSKCPYYTNLQKVWTSYFLLVQIRTCNNLSILLELHHFTDREILYLRIS